MSVFSSNAVKTPVPHIPSFGGRLSEEELQKYKCVFIILFSNIRLDYLEGKVGAFLCSKILLMNAPINCYVAQLVTRPPGNPQLKGSIPQSALE